MRAPETDHSERIYSELAHSERAHCRLGGSATYRYFNCHASILAAEGYPESTSEFAREGTVAHEMAQLCLENGQDAVEFIDREFDGFIVDESWAEAVQIYLDECRKYMTSGYVWWIEKPVSLEKLDPPEPMYGTADFVAYDKLTGLLVVIDFKFGRGVVVDIDGNPQLRFYALGAMLALPPEMPVNNILTVIVQPRVLKGKPFKSILVSTIDLIEWSMVLMDNARAALDPDAAFHPGPWCRSTFCKRDGQCHAQANAVLDFTKSSFAEFTEPGTSVALPGMQEISIKQRAAMLNRLQDLKDFIKAFEESSIALLKWDAQAIPGWTIEYGETRYKFLGIEDEDAVATKLMKSAGLSADQVWHRKLVTVAQARAALTANLRTDGLKAGEAKTRAAEMLKSMTIRPPSTNAKLVPLSSGASPSSAGVMDQFEYLDAPSEP
jgi:Protein of unknown function (DUF2800)